jgi:peptide/nickel transport system permease protein
MSRAAAAETPAVATDVPEIAARPTSLWRDTLGNVLRQRSAIVGITLLTILILTAILAPFIQTHDPTQTLLGHEEGITIRSAPCIHLLGCPESQPQHLFGLDGNYRDVFSRVVWGSRISLLVGLAAISFAVVIGTAIGAVSGYLGGSSDTVLMRLMEIVLAFPAFLLAIAVVSALGSSLQNAIIAISVVQIPIFARLVRSSVLSTKESDYVTASRALGESGYGILTRRIMPNSITPVVVAGTLGLGGAILEMAALAFIGVVTIGAPEWGTMIGIERNNIFTAPHTVLFAGIAITIAVLGFNLLGDGLRDALDPRLNR